MRARARVRIINVSCMNYMCVIMCYSGNLLRDKGDAEAAVSSYKNAIKYRPSLAGKSRSSVIRRFFPRFL